MEPTGRPTGPYPGGLSKSVVNIRLAHGNPVNLAKTLVVPVAKKRDVLGLEAPRLATVQQHREDAALVQPPLSGPRYPAIAVAIAGYSRSTAIAGYKRHIRHTVDFFDRPVVCLLGNPQSQRFSQWHCAVLLQK